jgi:UDPglucose 6-dehydrogenase
MKVSVVGSGYVGLVTGACLADIGHEVVCLDVDASKIERLNRGEIPIYEPGLDDVVARSVKAGRLQFTTDVSRSVAHGDIQFIAVGTPPDEDGSADLKYVLAAARSIAEHMQTSKIVVNKSTVPVGTGDRVAAVLSETLAKRSANIEYCVVSNPEFLKEGDAISDFMKPDRIVVGTDESPAGLRARVAMAELYASLTDGGRRFIAMDVKSAELTKYAANAMLATRISFMNELAALAEAVGADIEEVRVGMGSDARIGPAFLRAGIGYGGSCFPKDVQALVRIGEQNSQRLRILSEVEAVNNDQKDLLVRKLCAELGEDLTGKTIAVWGLAFKPNTDDMREAPSRVVIAELVRRGARVRAYDPVAMHEARRVLSTDLDGKFDAVSFHATALEAAQSVDALLNITEWLEFTKVDTNDLSAQMPGKLVLDGRNSLDAAKLRAAGFTVRCVGRGVNA